MLILLVNQAIVGARRTKSDGRACDDAVSAKAAIMRLQSWVAGYQGVGG